jgi:hypothetical protein
MLFDAVFEWVGEIFFLSSGSEEFVNTWYRKNNKGGGYL